MKEGTFELVIEEFVEVDIPLIITHSFIVFTVCPFF